RIVRLRNTGLGAERSTADGYSPRGCTPARTCASSASQRTTHRVAISDDPVCRDRASRAGLPTPPLGVRSPGAGNGSLAIEPHYFDEGVTASQDVRHVHVFFE